MNYLDRIALAIQQRAMQAQQQEPRGSDLPLYRIFAVLCLAKGIGVTEEDVHHAWAAWRSADAPMHPSCVPFAALHPSVQALDAPFKARKYHNCPITIDGQRYDSKAEARRGEELRLLERAGAARGDAEMSNPHTCHAKNCSVHVPPRMLMCRRHWFMVPKHLRDLVWANYREGQEIDKQPSGEWFDAAKAAIEAVAAKEAVTR